MNPQDISGEIYLELAAEDFDRDRFLATHVFKEYEESIIRTLVAHGPVLLRGGRGTGKSALMMEAARRLNTHPLSQTAIGVYLSARSLPLFRSVGNQYVSLLCSLTAQAVDAVLEEYYPGVGPVSHARDVAELHSALTQITRQLNKRMVLFFDDAAHIGREASLTDFFDVFRTISSSRVSCKTAIYPGVTDFGERFDVYNDATVVDVTRNEGNASFTPFFVDVARRRFARLADDALFSRELSFESAAGFIGRAVLGNIRAFVKIFGRLQDIVEEANLTTIGIPHLNQALQNAASDYYWPLIEEVKPKLGKYEPLVDPTIELATVLFKRAGETSNGVRAVLVHREHIQQLGKLFEILEYTGFVARREASRAMKSGGRGARYALNLCNLLEHTSPSRLTADLFKRWTGPDGDALEFHRNRELLKLVDELPPLEVAGEPAILRSSIDVLVQSKSYPYGLTQLKIDELKAKGIHTVSQLATCTEEWLRQTVPGVGKGWARRILNAVAQAIWM